MMGFVSSLSTSLLLFSWGRWRCGLSRPRRDGDVQVRRRAEFAQRRLNLRFVADEQARKLRRIHVLVGHAGDIGGGHALDAFTVLLQKIRRIAVERENDLLVERLFRRVVMEDEGVHHLIFRLAKLVVSRWLGLELADDVEESLGGWHRAGALSAQLTLEDTWMVILCAERAAHFIRKTELRTNLLHNPRAEPAGEDLIHNAECVVVRIVALGAQAENFHSGLVDVLFLSEIDAGLRAREIDFERRDGGAARERLKGLAPLGFHLGRVEVTPFSRDTVARPHRAA